MHEASDLLPLKPADFHVLLSLVDRPLHGYGIMKQVVQESGGEVRLEIGSLYRLLARLIDQGFLEMGEEDGRRRNYAITRLGRKALTAEARRLAGLVELVRSRRLLTRVSNKDA